MIDAHVHTWSVDPIRYPFAPHDRLEPPTESSSLNDFEEAAAGDDVTGVLLIQPRIYGYDHARLFDAAASSPGRYRAMPLINVVRPGSITEIRLHATHPLTAGFRVIAHGDEPASWLQSEQARRSWTTIAELSLPVGFLIDPPQLPVVAAVARAHPQLTVIIDHVARIRPSDSLEWLPALLRTAQLENVYVKLSALSSLSEQDFPHADMASIAHSLYSAFGPTRLMWGSDWPHLAPSANYSRERAVLLKAFPDIPRADLDGLLGETAALVLGFTTTTTTSGVAR